MVVMGSEQGTAEIRKYGAVAAGDAGLAGLWAALAGARAVSRCALPPQSMMLWVCHATAVWADGSGQTATCLFANTFRFNARPHLNLLPLLGEDFH